jgi:hypothetical protein
MRKTFVYLAIAATVVVFAIGCGKKEGHDHEHGTEAASETSAEEWKEMDSFHMIMAETFHPYKDSANLEPVKTHAEHLAIEAEKWTATTLPEKVNNDDVKSKLDKLKTDTRALADKVKAGGSDEEIAAQLTAVHDLFHEIQEAWYGGGHKGEHH